MSETQALIQHDDSPTAILSKKLRSLMQYNALQQGYLPSSSQIEEHLAAVVQSPLLNTRQRGLSRQTKIVLEDTRNFFKALGQLVKDKNQDDIVQEIIWNLRGANLESEIDGDIFAARLDAATAKADAKTAHLKAKAIADVLYSNPQFRALIHDGSILARDVLSDVVEATATAIAPEESDLIELEEEATDVDGRAIKDDVDETKRKINDGVESVKTQVKDAYDEATSAAMETVRSLQAKGQKFGHDVQEQASSTLDAAKETAESAVKQGRVKGQEFLDSASASADAAIAQLEKATGITQADLKSKLDEGISIEDIIKKAKDLANNASTQLQDVAHKADQQGGRLVQQAESATTDFVKRNDVEGKVKDTIKQGKSQADDATAKIKAQTSDLKQKGSEAASKTESSLQDAASEAKKSASGAKESVQQSANNAASTVESKSNDLKDQAKTTSSTEETQTPSSSHLKEIGIVHPDLPEDRDQGQDHLKRIGIIHPDTDTAQTTRTTGNENANAEQDDGSDLVQQVIAKIQEKVQGIEGISREDLDAAANDLIKKTSQTAAELKDSADGQSQEAGEKAKKYASQAKGQLDSATETGSKAAKAGVDQASAAGTKVKDQASQVAEKTMNNASNVVEDVKRQVDNIDTKDLQDAVNNLLKTTKNRLEEATGVTADDARQSLDWAIKRGEELAEQAMQKGREGSSVVQQKSADAMHTLQEKSGQAAEYTQSAAVTVGAQAKHALQNAPQGAAGQIHETFDASQELVNTAIEAVKDSTSEIRTYLSEKFPPKRRQAIQKHFQGLAVALRDNTDYSNGLDGLISIGKKYVDYTLTFTEELPTGAGDVVSTNSELDNAVKLTLKLIERFSNGVGFSGVQKAYTSLKKDMKKEKGSEDFFDDCLTYFKKIVQDMKYASSKDAEKHGHQLLDRIDAFSEDTGFKQDVNSLFQELVRLAEGFTNDKVLFNVVQKGRTCFKHLVMNEYGNFVFKKRVMKDFFNIIMPSALRLVQYIPISRIEFQNADIDVLIENLVLESSASHDQSFLPYRLKIDNHNQVEFLNAYKFESDYSNQVTIKIQGLTLAVRDAGFYIRKKTGFWRFSDSGLVDLIMDGPGIDIDIDIAMSTEDEDEDVTKDALFIVKDVRVNIHKLDFSTSGTKHGWLIGLVKPFIRGFIKRQVGLAVGAAMKEQLTYYEYQLRMLQHRIKTAYIANNGQASFESFFRAVFTANAGNNQGSKGQFEVVVGKQGPLAGIFTKASIQQEFEEADAIAHEHGRAHSWRNDIFDL